MEAVNPDSSELLRKEILADARGQCDEILRHAREEADVLLAKAAAEAEQIRQGYRAQAQTEAARQRMLLSATVAIETARLRSARVESLLQSIRQTTLQKLLAHDGFDYQETLIALATEALRRMAGERFVVKLSPADQVAFGKGLAERIGQRVGEPLTIIIGGDRSIKNGGAIVEDAEGRQIWDNQLLSRLERFWPELRRQIATGTSLISRSGASGGDT